MKNSTQSVVTNTSIVIILILWIIHLSYYQLYFHWLHIPILFTLLFSIRSAIATTHSYLYDSKHSSTRSTLYPLVYGWVIMLFLTYKLFEPLLIGS